MSALAAALLVSGVSLVGSYAFLLRQETLARLVPVLVSLAVGVMLGDAFLHLLPDAVQRTGNLEAVMLLTLAGMLLFFFLEKGVRRRHHRQNASPSAAAQPKPFATMNLVGDAVHNLVDGMLIAGSFLAGPAAGVLTTLALVIHEVPQEVGDVGTLVGGGYTVRKAVWYNFLCSLTCVVGAVLVLAFASFTTLQVDYLLPLAAGGFIYVATAGLIPELHRQKAARQQLSQ